MASVHTTVSAKTGKTAYVVRYRTPGHKQRSKSFRLKRDAKLFAAGVETTKATGLFVDPARGKIPVNEWVETWLAGKVDLAPTTRDNYTTEYRAHIEHDWASVALADVEHADVQAWVAGLNRTLAPASVRKAHQVLAEALEFAVLDGRLARNPARGVALPRVTAAEKRFLTHDEVARLADAAGECRPHGAKTGPPSQWRLVVLTLAYTGLRWGEFAALRVRDLDVLRRRLVVARSVAPVRGRLVVGDTKGHLRREVPVPRFLVADLERQIEGKGPDSPLFAGERGAVLRGERFRRGALRKASKELGIDPPLTAHELRHTAASLAIAAGADVKVVQQMLGHKSATMTLDLYGHLFPDRLESVAGALDEARGAAVVGGVRA
jgi:integrase